MKISDILNKSDETISTSTTERQNSDMANVGQQPLSPAATNHSFDDSTPTCANSAGAYPSNEQQLQTIHRLMDDKDRLLKEKNELIDSKNILWQEYYRAVGERDKQIEKLKGENEEAEEELAKQKERNHALIEALKKKNMTPEEVEEDDDGDETEDEEENASAASAENVTGKLGSAIYGGHGPGHTASSKHASVREGSADSFTFPDEETSSLFNGLKRGFVDDTGPGRHFTDDRPAAKRSKPSGKAPSRQIDTYFERLTKASVPCAARDTVESESTIISPGILDKAPSSSKPRSTPTKPTAAHEVIDLCSSPSPSPSVKPFDFKYSSTAGPVRRSFLSRPMQPKPAAPTEIEAPSRTGTLANSESNKIVFATAEALSITFEELSENVAASLRQFEREMNERAYKLGRVASHRPKSNVCGWLWMYGHAGRTRWTTEEPMQYACETCFNRRRACLRLDANYKAVVLPLPPEVRKAFSTPQDDDYFIRALASMSSVMHLGIWAESAEGMRNKYGDSGL